jgi:hypothetical protein
VLVLQRVLVLLHRSQIVDGPYGVLAGSTMELVAGSEAMVKGAMVFVGVVEAEILPRCGQSQWCGVHAVSYVESSIG